MGVQERREREKVEMRRRILDAARELFARQGYDQVTMRGIAEAIEYSPTTIYHHFKDKDEMVECLCREDFGRLQEAFRTADFPADPVERIRAIGLVYARFGVEHPNHYRFLFMTPPPADFEMPAREAGDMIGAQAFGVLHSAVVAAAEAGRLRPIDPLAVSQVLWATVHGAVSLLITVPADCWPDGPVSPRLIEETIDNALRGLVVETPARKEAR